MTPNHIGLANSSADKPATAAHISTWSPAMMPKAATSPPRSPACAVEVSKARLPGPGIAKKRMTAPTKVG
jgi:hypothetical protein